MVKGVTHKASHTGDNQLTAAEYDDDHVLNQDLEANRPAAGVAGRLFYASDTKILYRDDGSAWVELFRAEAETRLAQLSEKAHSSLTGLAADDHTRYFDKDGSKAMTGDLQLGDYRLKTTNLLLKELVPTALAVKDVGDAAGAYRDLYLRSLYPADFVEPDSGKGIRTNPTGLSDLYFQSHDGVVYQNCIKLVGGLAELIRCKLTGALDLNGQDLTNPKATVYTGFDTDKVDGLHSSDIEQVVNKNAANGYAGLNASSRIAQAQAFTDTVALIANDETSTSMTLPSAETDLKTHSLAANSYSKVTYEAEIRLEYSATARTVTIRLYYGATVKRTYTINTAAAGGADLFVPVKYSEQQQAAATLKLTVQGSAADAGLTVEQISQRVYGVV